MRHSNVPQARISYIPRACCKSNLVLSLYFRFSFEVFAFLLCLTFVMSASKKSSMISRPPRRPMDDYAWESLGALTADLAGMSADMAQLAHRSSPSVLPPKDTPPSDTVLQDRASLPPPPPPPPPPRDTNSGSNVALPNLAQSASTDPPHDLDLHVCRLVLAKETQLIEVEKLKLQLELARIQALLTYTITDGSNPAKLHDPKRS